ncbi:response regulator [Asticcacaulis sp. AC466]|uniref:response regulator n=1 Tax=Asticcacaulis sp. AC466 TaxID=1282362 RepID=UPI00040B0C19|nr:response regulator [Asticcacaulis sp. AC466]
MHTAAAPAGHALRILAVDDNREAALSIKDAVEDFGDTAFVCFKGHEALELAGSIRPDVILLDLSMPDIDGVDVARILRADPRLAGVKIIALTAYGDAEARQKTAAAGFDLHLTKPVRFEVLADMLDLLRLAPKR